jgi:hypothetical protein
MSQLLLDTDIVIGTDGIYQTLDLKVAEQHFAIMKEKIDPKGDFRARFPSEDPDLNTPRKMAFIHGSIALRYGKEFADNVCGENLRRFFLASLPR